MLTELYYRIALSQVPNIGAVHARTLIDLYGDASEVFKAKKNLLEKTEGIGSIRARNIKEFNNFKRVSEEIAFIDKYKIEALFLTDEKYPKRFLNCYDPPTMLYYKGTADLNCSRVLSIVGTRMHTDYGKQVTEQLVKDLATLDVTVVSGLAFGIDAIAHKTALRCSLPTVGVIGHGLDTIYPSQHSSLAKEMVQMGGLLTEFTSRTKPDKHNFPIRNRIVAGISDATIVIETSMKGGSMITAEMANSYNRDVFAIPGRTTDPRSAGCNYLVKTNKAILLTDSNQLIETLGWAEKKRKPVILQRDLFITLSDDEKTVTNILSEHTLVSIDQLHFLSKLSSSTLAAVILNLEFQGVIASLPGKSYKLM
jgi:DNA processing protein